VTLRWDGSLETSPIAFGASGCTGAVYLNSRTAVSRRVFARRVAYSKLTGQLYVPTATTSAAMTAVAVDNDGACRTSTVGSQGWALSTTTRVLVGLPSTISGPLTFQ
jgi:hypothetical protein